MDMDNLFYTVIYMVPKLYIL